MNIQTEKTSRILKLTSDGDELQAQDLQLVEMAAGGQLNADGLDVFERLYTDVTSGNYRTKHHWFYGLENLTQDTRGYVYWKGISVEHFDHVDSAKGAAAAHRLVDKCHRLEANGFPVNSRTVLQKSCYDAEPNSPWKEGLTHYYAFMRRGDHVACVFYVRHPESGDKAVSAYKAGGSIQLSYHQWGSDAPDALKAQGFESAGTPEDYPAVVALLTATGLTPTEADKIINAASPADRLSVLYSH